MSARSLLPFLLSILLLLAACAPIAVPLPDLSGSAPPPDVAFTTPDGETVQLSDYQGNVLFVNFWGTYCPPCLDEMPDLQAAYENLAADDFVILGVDVEESPEKVTSWTQENGITFPIAISDDGTINPVLGLHRMPTTWFIDADGILRGKIEGQMSAQLIERVARMLLEE
jgi:peroxiredoxin